MRNRTSDRVLNGKIEVSLIAIQWTSTSPAKNTSADSQPQRIRCITQRKTIWFDLNGRIVAFNGQNTREVGNISELISNCHTEAGLLGFAFVSDYAMNPQILFTYIGTANVKPKK